MAEARCEIEECRVPLVGDSHFDAYFKKRCCPSCFEKSFRAAETHGFGEWWEKNYKFTDYPPDFWKRVGAFIDLTGAAPKSVYKLIPLLFLFTFPSCVTVGYLQKRELEVERQTKEKLLPLLRDCVEVAKRVRAENAELSRRVTFLTVEKEKLENAQKVAGE